jgi:hypothetical protein
VIAVGSTMILAALGAMFAVDAIIAWYHRKPRRRGKARRTGQPALGVVDPETTERRLTARLLAKKIDQRDYQAGMAAVTATADGLLIDGELWHAMMVGRALRQRLRAVLPGVSWPTLRAAVNLVRYGATVDDLIRLLGLTMPQGLQVTALVRDAAPKDR